ncbi:glycosyltransferase [Flavobacterium gelidilacus]|uniref:glycosyltransferase n=1 Tax=Flavobacterium gelidilacus TaxID=206041 RepID=UPI0004229749|nr:glycosyltransferase [Flavobacterium gelidilacus]
MKQNPHIVFLTPGFAVSEADSTTIPAQQIFLKALQKSIPNAKLTIIAFHYPFQKKQYKWFGFDVIPLNGKNNKLKKIITWYKVIQTLKNLNKEQKITTIHSFWIGECAFIGNYFSKKNKTPHVTTAMGQDVNTENLLPKLINFKNRKIVSQSKIQQEILLRNHHINSTIIPWNLDIDSFPEIKESTIDILGVGSLNEVKNYSLFIDIVSDLVQIKPNLKIEIIGDGQQFEFLKNKIETRKLAKNISLLGLLSRNEVLLKMSQTTLLLHTSTFEGFGYVFAEALYSGMKIISFNVGTSMPSSKWKIANSKEEMIQFCNEYLNQKKSFKQRFLLNSENETVSSYLKLYNEKNY